MAGAAARRQPVPAVAAPAEQVEGALEISDGRWRVEVVRRDRHLSDRLLHANNMIEGLDLVGILRLLAEQNVDLADLVEPARDDNPRGRIGAA